ncbi:MAG: hypothetical protein EBZ49_17700, partial [Proteobacteria bacterium]|nr:hypothetical protein [Pseudomonadota bacterium]
MLKVYARLSLFFAYLGIFFTFPWCFLTIPWAVAVGFCLTVFFLLFITHQFSLTLLFKLNALPLSEENEPGTFEMVHRFCRDLGITPPKLFESVHAAPNLCVFGLSPNNTYLVVTRGLLNSCSRGELGTLLCRSLIGVSSGQTMASSWLSSFLSFLEKTQHHGTSNVLYRVFIYPLAFIPLRLLSSIHSDDILDYKTLNVSENPEAFLTSLQLLNSQRSR